ncbi:MAG: hypothetical protein AAF352_05900 [Pseudomonadota bacterium]
MKSVINNASRTDHLEFVLRLDIDDPAIQEYQMMLEALKTEYPHVAINVRGGSRCKQSLMWNQAAELANNDLIMMGNDDCILHTKNWDTYIKDVPLILGHNYFVLVGDIYTKGLDKSSSFPCVSREYYAYHGYYAPGIYYALCTDVWISEIASMAGCLVSVKGLRYKHLHVKYGAMLADETHGYARRREYAHKDSATHHETKELREIIAKSLRGYLDRLVVKNPAAILAQSQNIIYVNPQENTVEFVPVP